MVDIIDTKQTSVELINLADIFSKFFFCCLRMVRKGAFDSKYWLIAELKMGLIKDRNGMDLTEAEDIKKRWQQYTEELY